MSDSSTEGKQVGKVRTRRQRKGELDYINYGISARKKIKKAGIGPQKLLSVLMDNIPDRVYFKDVESRIVKVNKATAARFESGNPEQMIGKTDFDYFTEPCARWAYEGEQEMLKTGKPLIAIEAKEVWLDGRKDLWISSSKIPFYDDQGHPLGIFGITRDITRRNRAEEELQKARDQLEKQVEERTAELSKANEFLRKQIAERKKTEKALRKSQTQQQALLDGSPDAITQVDVNMKVMWANKTTLDIIPNIVGQFCYKACQGRDEPCRGCPCQKAVKTRQIQTSVMRHIDIGNIQGESFWECTGVPLKDQAGKVYGAIEITNNITARKLAENALAHERNLLRILIDNLPYLIWVKDKEGRFKLCNLAQAHRVNRKKPEELIGKTDFDFYPYEPSAKFYADEQKIVQTGKAIINKVAQSSLPSGEKRWISITKIPLFDEKGSVENIVGLMQDITEHKLIEQKIKDSEEKYRTLVEETQDGVFIVQDDRVQFANTALARMLGCMTEEIIGKYFQSFIAPEDLRPVIEHYRQKLAGKDVPGEYEFRLLHKDGKTRIIVVANMGIIDYQDRTASMGMVKNVTEHKRAQEALQESERRFRELAESLPEIICETDEHANLKFVNHNAFEAFGYTRDDFSKGLNAFNMLIPEERERAAESIQAVLKFEKVGGPEFTALRKDGSTFPVVIYSSPIIRGNKAVGLRAVIINITERRKAEEKLLDYQSQLKSLASELSLAEERERRRIAVELHDRISQSLVTSKIKLDELRASSSSAKLGKDLDKVCALLNEAVQDTRTLTFDLSSPILYEFGLEAAVAEWLADEIETKCGIATEFEDDGQPKTLEDDVRVLLFRDVRELLINVVKHAQAHKVKVSISKVDSQIQIIVKDDGIGFEPAAKSAAVPADGGGFGLFSIRERLGPLGGVLEIESKPGRGSKVTIMAPLKCEKIIDEA